MSMARRLSSQARLSSLPTIWAVQPSSASLARRRASFSAGVTPAYSAGSSQAGVAGSGGRFSVHSSSSRLRVQTVTPLGSSTFCRPRTSWQEAVRPHRPSFSPSCKASAQYCSTVGTPGSPIRISSISVPASCFSAWTKNRPSAHRALLVRVTTRVEFSPVKPEKYSRLL